MSLRHTKSIQPISLSVLQERAREPRTREEYERRLLHAACDVMDVVKRLPEGASVRVTRRFGGDLLSASIRLQEALTDLDRLPAEPPEEREP